ncbi:MAG TPA: hypothetical protein VKT32_16190, partial [Chthonomonadaceae bacterium]|nr:hypothetical protein [Chthonomonadaceae bacterium]
MKTNRVDNNPLRGLPSVNRLLAAPAVREMGEHVPAGVLTEAARAVLEAARGALAAGNGQAAEAPSEAELAARVVAEARRRAAPSLLPAINATGIVLHTGLGRARLSEAAQRAVQAVAAAHSVLEIERETGRRGSRRDHVRGLL